jgi:hypothetical protein
MWNQDDIEIKNRESAVNTDSSIKIFVADYGNPQHAAAIVNLLDHYARGASGGGEALPLDVQQRLVSMLARCGNALSLIAHCDDQPAGLLNAFETVSTFRAQARLLQTNARSARRKSRRAYVVSQFGFRRLQLACGFWTRIVLAEAIVREGPHANPLPQGEGIIIRLAAAALPLRRHVLPATYDRHSATSRVQLCAPA